MLSNDLHKKAIAKDILAKNCAISSHVCLKRLGLSVADTKEALQAIIDNSIVYNIDAKTTIQALDLKEKYKFQFYDSLIISSALENSCEILYSEDMQNGQIIENRLKIVNPYLHNN
ncbi:MAG: hypothetical protein RL154_99 [Pseudomonadota bacterium]